MPDQLDVWIDSHLQAIPALPFYAEQAKEVVALEYVDHAVLSELIARDPGYSSQLFNQLNAPRKKSQRDYLESIQSALSLMGDSAIVRFIENTAVLNESHSSFPNLNLYLALVARAQHAVKHSKLWASLRGSEGIKEVGVASKLYDIAEYAVCLFDAKNYTTYIEKKHSSDDVKTLFKDIFEFDLHQLSARLCGIWHLPELIVEAHEPNPRLGLRSKGIKLAAELTHAAEVSWYDERMSDCLIKVADLCQKPFDEMCKITHQSCIEVARELEFSTDFIAPANLLNYADSFLQGREVSKVLVAEEEYQPAAEPVEEAVKPAVIEPESEVKSILAILKQAVSQPEISQSQLLKILLDGIRETLGVSRSALFLLNKDLSELAPRLTSGLDASSPLLKCSLQTKQAGIFKILLAKPQAIWINANNFKKYQTHLPELFMSCSLSNDFFMMSLFSGKRALGVVYCDVNAEDRLLKQEQFDEFKRAVSLASKALLVITQRRQKAKPSAA